MSKMSIGPGRSQHRHQPLPSYTPHRLNATPIRKAASPNVTRTKLLADARRQQSLEAQIKAWLSEHENHGVQSIRLEVVRGDGDVCYHSSSNKGAANNTPSSSPGSGDVPLPVGGMRTSFQTPGEFQAQSGTASAWLAASTTDSFRSDNPFVEGAVPAKDAQTRQHSTESLRSDELVDYDACTEDDSNDADSVDERLSRFEHRMCLINDPDRVTAHLDDLIGKMQQLWSKVVAKAWIKGICPKKQAKFPYMNRKRKEFNMPENSPVPGFWPDLSKCPFVEPDHIKKDERQSLLLHLLRLRPTPEQLCGWNRDHGVNELRPNLVHGQLWTDFLQALTPESIFYAIPRDTRIKKQRRLDLLKQIFDVARREEKYILSVSKIGPTLVAHKASPSRTRQEVQPQHSTNQYLAKKLEDKPVFGVHDLPASASRNITTVLPRADTTSYAPTHQNEALSFWHTTTLDTKPELLSGDESGGDSQQNTMDWLVPPTTAVTSAYPARTTVSAVPSTRDEVVGHSSTSCATPAMTNSPFNSISGSSLPASLSAYQADVPWSQYYPATESGEYEEGQRTMPSWLNSNHSSFASSDASDSIFPHDGPHTPLFSVQTYCSAPPIIPSHVLPTPTSTATPNEMDPLAQHWCQADGFR